MSPRTGRPAGGSAGEAIGARSRPEDFPNRAFSDAAGAFEEAFRSCRERIASSSFTSRRSRIISLIVEYRASVFLQIALLMIH